MGQRHQIFYLDDDQRQFVYHDQWCYGTLPLRLVKRVIDYQTKTEETGRLGYYNTDSEMVRAIISCDPSKGFYSNSFDVTDEHKREGHIYLDAGDNNDGITIIIANKNSKQIAYCFMFIDENEFYEPFVPLSAREYVRAYYEPNEEKWTNWKIDKLVSAIDRKARLITYEELKKHFPNHYPKDTEWEKIIKAKKKDLPLYISSEYENNRALVAHLLKGDPKCTLVPSVS